MCNYVPGAGEEPAHHSTIYGQQYLLSTYIQQNTAALKQGNSENSSQPCSDFSLEGKRKRNLADGGTLILF